MWEWCVDRQNSHLHLTLPGERKRPRSPVAFTAFLSVYSVLIQSMWQTPKPLRSTWYQWEHSTCCLKVKKNVTLVLKPLFEAVDNYIIRNTSVWIIFFPEMNYLNEHCLWHNFSKLWLKEQRLWQSLTFICHHCTVQTQDGWDSSCTHIFFTLIILPVCRKMSPSIVLAL